jgi:hypothetical protein
MYQLVAEEGPTIAFEPPQRIVELAQRGQTKTVRFTAWEQQRFLETDSCPLEVDGKSHRRLRLGPSTGRSLDATTCDTATSPDSYTR